MDNLKDYSMSGYVILFITVILTSCALNKQSIPEELYSAMSEEEETFARVESRNILSNLALLNKDLKTYKGLGKLKLWTQTKQPVHERFAWVASKPNSIGIVIMVSGQPILRFSTDGKYIYFLDLNRPKESFKKIRVKKAGLDKLVSIPISVEDIVMLLAGQTPMRQHTHSILVPDKNKNGFIILLEDKRYRVIEKIFINKSKDKVKNVEIYYPNGELVYRANFEEMLDHNKFTVPSRLSVRNDKGDGFLITVNRFIENAAISTSAFIINPPKKP